MSDTSNKLPETFTGQDGTEYERVRKVTIAGAHMTFGGYCPEHCSEGGYVPFFPFFMNNVPQPGFYCGACLTRCLHQVRQDPEIEIQDYRWVLYN